MRLDQRGPIFLTKAHAHEKTIKKQRAFFEEWLQNKEPGAKPKGITFITYEEYSQNCFSWADRMSICFPFYTDSLALSNEYRNRCIKRSALRHLKSMFDLSMKDLSIILGISDRKLFRWLEKGKNDDDYIPIAESRLKTAEKVLLKKDKVVSDFYADQRRRWAKAKI
jgi:hypothetical protein